MVQLVHEIVLAEEIFADDPISAVQHYCSEMNRRWVLDDELPPRAVISSWLEYYVLNVQNGNIGQFVMNSAWAPGVVRGVRTGLQAIGASAQAELFEDVVQFVESNPADLKAALDSDEGPGNDAVMQVGFPRNQRFQMLSQVVIGEYSGDFAALIADASGANQPARGPAEAFRRRLNNIRGGFFAAFAAHPDGYQAGCGQIRTLNEQWVRSWLECKRISLKQQSTALDQLAQAVPYRESRMNQYRRPWQEVKIEELLTKSKLSLSHITTINTVDTASSRFTVWNVSTSKGIHHVAFFGQEGRLYRGGSAKLVATVPAPEAPAHSPPDGWEKERYLVPVKGWKRLLPTNWLS